MKQWGLILFIAGAIVAGGTAVAGSGDKCNVCHYGAHDQEREYGDKIVTSESGWYSSHKPHGDCTMDYAMPVYDENGDQIGEIIGVEFEDGSCLCQTDLFEEDTPTTP
jgi:hypothetical protein